MAVNINSLGEVHLDNIFIGYIMQNIYVTPKKTEVFFRKYQGYAIAEEALNELKNRGVTKIRIKEIGKKGLSVYECDINKYLMGKSVQFGDYEKQKVIPLSEMEKLLFISSNNEYDIKGGIYGKMP